VVVGGTTEVAGLEGFGLDEWVRRVLTAPYFGAVPGAKDLRPGPDAHLAETTLADWLARDTRS
jgi:hypothetical protein